MGPLISHKWGNKGLEIGQKYLKNNYHHGNED